MVKFQEYYVTKRYKHQAKKYRGVLLRIPKNLQPKVDPFIHLEFKMKDIVSSETADERILDIILSTKKHAKSKQPEPTA